MKKNREISTLKERERALLVGVLDHHSSRLQIQEYLEELALLADTAGANVIGQVVQGRDRFDSAFFIGSGKVEQIAEQVIDQRIDVVIFDGDLSAVQVRNLEQKIKCKILDRSGLILDIFASHAKTNEAKTQVQMAQLQYLLPRLTRQWTHLSKQYGGIGTKGPGEQQLETDRRVIRTRIRHLKDQLERISQQRQTQRRGRDQFTRVALVGYTNVGKSTLMNVLSDANVFVEYRLFATLDATVRLVALSPAHRILLSDTVGFIRKLPHHLIASFKSTLDEVIESDILLHVVDASHSAFPEQIQIVNDTLAELHANKKPTMMVFNKIDRLEDRTVLAEMKTAYSRVVFVSGTRGINIDGLRQEIVSILDSEFAERTVALPVQEQRLLAFIHSSAEIIEKRYENESVVIRFRAHQKDLERIGRELKEGLSPRATSID
ncbi:MAG: GTPase HflX [Bacteroidota bacterium]